MNPKITPVKPPNDLKGLNQLSQEGINGVVDVVEAMHQRVLTLGGLLNQGDLNKTGGLTGFVYQTIRNSVAFSTKGVDFALSQFKPLKPSKAKTQVKRNQWVSILNGVMGDHLLATGNPLAMAMSWQFEGQDASPEQAAIYSIQNSNQPLLLIHGLCMNDELWQRKGHDHGAELKRSNRMAPIYVRYNTGLAVYQNGHQLEQMLEAFFMALPADKTMDVLCHSMGGLVLRSALNIAEQKQANWLHRINKVVFLGTPHQGAVLEKTGNILDYLISINPYSAPFSKLAHVRSHGIKNLRHGTITADHKTIQLPVEIDCYALAASTPVEGHDLHQKWIGDGLVTVDSALGGHRHPEREVMFKASHKKTFQQVNHMGLLSDARVYEALKKIFQPAVDL